MGLFFRRTYPVGGYSYMTHGIQQNLNVDDLSAYFEIFLLLFRIFDLFHREGLVDMLRNQTVGHGDVIVTT